MEKILIIEDDRHYSELVERALAAEGFQVHSAGTMKEGLALIGRERPDAIVLDLGLPDSPGHLSVQRVKEFSGSAVIVVLSGHEDAAKDCIMQSASGFINKDHGLKYLGAEIRSAIKTFQKIQHIDQALTGLSACHI